MVEVRKFGTADDLKAFKKAKSDLTAKISLDFTAKKWKVHFLASFDPPSLLLPDQPVENDLGPDNLHVNWVKLKQ